MSSSVSRDRGHSGFLLGSISESNFQNGGLNARATVCGVGRLVAAAWVASFGKFSDAGATAKDNRLFLQAILWRFAVARSATCLWPLEQPVPAVSPVGQVWCMRGSFQSGE